MYTNLLSGDQKQFFDENGYLILEGFFPAAQIAQARARLDDFWANRGPSCPLVIDRLDDGERTYFREVANATRQIPYKLNDVHLEDEVFRDLAADARLTAVVAELLLHTPLVINTLLFERSSQQPAHFDTFFMPSRTPNKMCASWIAIDPVTETNGPLFYYPKSHLIEPFRFSSGDVAAIDVEMAAAGAHIERIIGEYGLEEMRFFPRPGDVLIWHAQLLHGGATIIDNQATRTSLVTHYWTVLDHPDPAEWIVVGDGRYLLRKSHPAAIGKSERAAVDQFVRGLATPPEHLVDVPAGFDPRGYLLHNMDVFRAGVDPYSHYHHFGPKERRSW